MQLQVLVSFFFAYIAAVKAAPIQLPAEGIAEVPSVPAVPNVARDTPIELAISVNPFDLEERIVDESSIPSLPLAVPGLPGGVSPVEDKDLTDFLDVVKRDGVTDALPNTDEALKVTEELPSLPVSLPATGRRDVIHLIPSIPLEIHLRQLDTNEPSLPPAPSVPGVDDFVKRQVDVPDVPNVGDIPSLPTTPTVPAKLAVRVIDLEGIPLGEAPHLSLPDINVPPALAELPRRQVDLPSTPNVEEITLPTTPSVPAKLPVRAVGDVPSLELVQVPEVPVDAAKLVDPSAVNGLDVRQLPPLPELPEIPEFPGVPSDA